MVWPSSQDLDEFEVGGEITWDPPPDERIVDVLLCQEIFASAWFGRGCRAEGPQGSASEPVVLHTRPQGSFSSRLAVLQLKAHRGIVSSSRATELEQ